MYIENYVKKAEEHFENEDYDQTLKYLSKAKEYNFKQENFKYYNKLIEIQNQKINEHIKENNLPENNNEYIIYDSHIRYLTKSELYKYSKSELALIRNEIFARYGYIFNKDEYFNYFINTSWYIPNPNFNGSINELNNIERYNVELIKSLEQGY
nr:YARHG domain-containing protein [[Eubacterium] tenue]